MEPQLNEPLYLNCVYSIKDFVISRFVLSRFCSIHFTVTLARLKNITRYTEDFDIFFSLAKVTVKCMDQNPDTTNLDITKSLIS